VGAFTACIERTRWQHLGYRSGTEHAPPLTTEKAGKNPQKIRTFLIDTEVGFWDNGVANSQHELM
jgi:hypothetical protein